MGERGWECEDRKAELHGEGREGKGEKREMLLRVLDGNFSNEKTMTALTFGLHQYESLQALLLTPECSLLLLTQEEHQTDHIEGCNNS